MTGSRSLQAFKRALHLHQGFHRSLCAFGHQSWADGFTERSNSFSYEELHGMGLRERSQGLLVKESQQALDNRRGRESPMPEWKEPTSFLENSGRAWEKNDRAHGVTSARQVREEAAASAANFRLSPRSSLPHGSPFCASAPPSFPRAKRRCGITSSCSSGVGSGEQDKSKGGCSDLNVKDVTLWWRLVLHLFTHTLSLVFVACFLISFPVWAWGEGNPKKTKIRNLSNKTWYLPLFQVNESNASKTRSWTNDSQ